MPIRIPNAANARLMRTRPVRLLRRAKEGVVPPPDPDPVPTAPPAITDDMWSVSTGDNPGEIKLSILSELETGGAALDQLAYRLDGLAWVPTFPIQGPAEHVIVTPEAGIEYQVRLRTRNIVGSTLSTTSKPATSKAAPPPDPEPEPEPGPTYDADASALFARMTVQPDDTRKALINERIIAAKAMSWWAKIDAIWVHAAHAQQAARLNWKESRYDCLPVNNPGFEVDRGYRGNGSTSYLDTQFNPVVAVGAHFVQDSAAFGVRSNDDNKSSGSLAGFWDGSKGCTINPRDNSDTFPGRVHQGNARNFGPSPTAIGMFVANRLPGNTIQGYINGERKYNDAITPPATMADGTLRIGAISATSLRACQFSMGFISGGLTEQEALDLFNWFETYRIAVGVV